MQQDTLRISRDPEFGLTEFTMVNHAPIANPTVAISDTTTTTNTPSTQPQQAPPPRATTTAIHDTQLQSEAL
ncbi:hypothetical protein BGZ47_005851, partial [Haplosporangium gracile]